MKARKALFRLSKPIEGFDFMKAATFLTVLYGEGFEIFGTDYVVNIMKSIGNNIVRPVSVISIFKDCDVFIIDSSEDTASGFIAHIPEKSFCLDFKDLESEIINLNVLRILCLDPNGIVKIRGVTVSEFTKGYRESIRSQVELRAKYSSVLKDLKKDLCESADYVQSESGVTHDLVHHFDEVSKTGKSPYLKAWFASLNSRTYCE